MRLGDRITVEALSERLRCACGGHYRWRNAERDFYHACAAPRLVTLGHLGRMTRREVDEVAAAVYLRVVERHNGHSPLMTKTSRAFYRKVTRAAVEAWMRIPRTTTR